MQLLDAGVGVLDAVLYTHPHADHVHGIDDLRLVVFNTRRKLAVWADEPTSRELLHRFDYIFETPPGSGYPPLCDLHRIQGPVTVDGAGGPLTFRPFTVEHGTIPALGFRMGGLAYLPDVSAIPDEVWPLLEDLDCLVLDGLRYKPHPTHAHLAQSLEWIARLRPRKAVITNMHVDLDYATLQAELPPGVVPAHDGLEIAFDP
jgi:phosphoribosyl 1,2-cyclic phosphate phosphodiesterase